ncbi:GIY-YIG catalytic domain-containing endonuclease [Paramecium bursaria Chlorella virus NYs1]|uniref:GIY-YIG catalytic domain-containing endonuclease n=1 Tax=Paramecium bursaria Chlorella virus NYs1 TaxID=83442 RepID=M1I850_9PHYC|nr:GIY-YIG catalytic domain-containing endonuclease [Paramecium bursaria Chlorella virus NYs1]AGE54187.1 GIY-YIG catalytic domain-containing endonuclease [Paramecium bursaria Chlorella virus IL-5-2s1]AGE58684.1 GIY-YIG catalytic domain-containing endonuclease [Paramecium bursaria Chlorella virus NYs1]
MMFWVVYAISKNIPIVDLLGGAMLIVDPETWNYLYIGVTNNFERRMKEHYFNAHDESYETSQKFYRRIRNRWDAFDKTILVRDIRTEQEAKDLEIELIAKYNSYKNGMNSTRGGDGTGSGSDHYRARKIIAYNNKTGEETSYTYIGECAEKLGIDKTNIGIVLSPEINSTQAKSKDGIWYQFKYAEDYTDFIENLPMPGEKISGANNHKARKIISYNNKTGENKTYMYIRECAEKLGISEKNISNVLSSYDKSTQARSKDGTWYQFKYAEDDTSFVEYMPTKSEKRSGGRNPRAHPVCAFGKLYDSAISASRCLVEVVDTNDKQFITTWIHCNKFPDDIFKVSKEFYESYKDSDIRITKAHIES